MNYRILYLTDGHFHTHSCQPFSYDTALGVARELSRDFRSVAVVAHGGGKDNLPYAPVAAFHSGARVLGTNRLTLTPSPPIISR